MFGMSFPEILVIAIIAVIALGPEKLPKAMVEIAKYFKIIKKSVNDAKSSFEQEIRIAELKEDAKKYKDSMAKTQENIRKKLTFEELDELKNGINSVKSSANETLEDIKKDLGDLKPNLAKLDIQIDGKTEEITPLDMPKSQKPETKDEKPTSNLKENADV
ncbi:Sec-independent protein translocase protein TatB [Campylobacter geochelonis]|uniref:Sec-independent protein translocase protein TatB homolog n=1 Tax=Campylobacter geochelonis TaxID=1780362 RepID=A0A128EFH2_9BACT|nr:Sec-independent protein translocase protein TatB [Campylobacter geochelonis]QKF71022.1 twin arginine translocation system, TatB protein [Campylobacter geochelonis]CZE47172.1 sec-independent translocase [Campylobacter geochelonis]